MFDNYSPPQQTPSAPPPPQKIIRFDKGYLKTLPGILKLTELICNIAGFICIKISWAWLSAIFFNILYWVGIMVTLFLLLMYTFHFVEKYDRWPWFKGEFFFSVAMALAYIVTSIFASTIGESVGYAVSFFGFCAIIAYGLDAYLKYKGWKRGLPPQ
ncbi:plasmolipin [Aricia agestis]|uniref:plasmolipin n=1 Tax=Aricia agestis TaxID=91739 RepID=UPI001C205FF1|nr:plasmolipin [Aricia agestis]